jgi:ParB family chromosome partitioning protein
MELELRRLELRYAGLRVMEKKRQARLVASLAEVGQQNPVLVVGGEGDRYVLIDGYRRVGALKELARDTVKAMVLPLGEVEALCWIHTLERSRECCVLEEAWFLRELASTHGLSQGEIAVRMGRTKSWVSRRLGLVQVLPEAVQDLVRRGRVCAHAAAKYLVPLARANRTTCEVLAGKIQGCGLSDRDVGRLYQGLRATKGEERTRVLEQPLLYLKAAAEVSPEKTCSSPEERTVLRDLEVLGGICRRVRRRVREQGYPLVPPARRAWERTRLEFEALRETLEEEEPHAGHGHTLCRAASST